MAKNSSPSLPTTSVPLEFQDNIHGEQNHVLVTSHLNDIGAKVHFEIRGQVVMKIIVLFALVALVALAEKAVDDSLSPQETIDDKSDSSQEMKYMKDMTGFRDHRPSHPVYIYAPHFDIPIDSTDLDVAVMMDDKSPRKPTYGDKNMEGENAA
ncbi:hypothetical protein AC1031_004460 [Aphanomyces cochlioides]|nr:hypothetical protein AC1031_004460 [Aphanomyces cochlioides]